MPASIVDIVQQSDKFQALSPQAQQIVLAKIQGRFNLLSPMAQNLVMQRLTSQGQPMQTPASSMPTMAAARPAPQVAPAPVASAVQPAAMPVTPRPIPEIGMPSSKPVPEMGMPTGMRYFNKLAAQGRIKDIIENPAYHDLPLHEKKRLVNAAGTVATAEDQKRYEEGLKFLGDVLIQVTFLKGIGKAGKALGAMRGAGRLSAKGLEEGIKLTEEKLASKPLYKLIRDPAMRELMRKGKRTLAENKILAQAAQKAIAREMKTTPMKLEKAGIAKRLLKLIFGNAWGKPIKTWTGGDLFGAMARGGAAGGAAGKAIKEMQGQYERSLPGEVFNR